MKYKQIQIISLIAFATGSGILTAMEPPHGDNPVKQPYFNKIGIIEKKDDKRWEEAITAAIKLPLEKTTSQEVLRVFGERPSCIGHYDECYEYTYFYPYLEQNMNEERRKQSDETKNFVVLFFIFDKENKLQSVGLQFMPCPIPASAG